MESTQQSDQDTYRAIALGQGGIELLAVASSGVNEVCPMSFLILKAYLNLIRFDLYLARGNFAALHDKVSSHPVRKTTPVPDAVECICLAVDMACIWYWKEALCLQRSAATSCLLKSHGISAQMESGHNSCHSSRTPGLRWMVAWSTTKGTWEKYTQSWIDANGQ